MPGPLSGAAAGPGGGCEVRPRAALGCIEAVVSRQGFSRCDTPCRGEKHDVAKAGVAFRWGGRMMVEGGSHHHTQTVWGARAGSLSLIRHAMWNLLCGSDFDASDISNCLGLTRLS